MRRRGELAASACRQEDNVADLILKRLEILRFGDLAAGGNEILRAARFESDEFAADDAGAADSGDAIARDFNVAADRHSDHGIERL